LKRIAIVVTAVVVGLVAAVSAYAAANVNSYSATYSFKGAGKGTAAKPAPLSFTQNIKVKATMAGNRTGILHEIDTTLYGAKVDETGFPTCTAAKIVAASNDTACPKKALVAHGYIDATLGSPTNFATSVGQACDPSLDVWNAGQGKLAFFFVETASHQCLGGQLHTGQVAPYPATYKQVGKKLEVKIPIPNSVDYPLGKSGGLVGSLSAEKLMWTSQTMGSKHSIESVGCSGSKRTYSYTFNASLPGAAAQVSTTKGSASCG
jgi:hypothetical protein